MPKLSPFTVSANHLIINFRTGSAARAFYTPGVNPERNGSVPARDGRGVLYCMHALGRHALPERVTAAGRAYRIRQFVKHDFFAATGFYVDEASGDPVVVKIGRTEPFFGLPTAFVGRWLTGRETRFYRRLAGVPNVPALVARFGPTGFIHEYVPGQPLRAGQAVPVDFFDELLALIDRLEACGIAIVDTNKPENILLGDDGRPHLIDFQISYDTRDLGNLWPAKPILRMFARTDRYHVLKHKSRLRPDLTTAAEQAVVDRNTWPVRLHRRLTRPYFVLRRRLFAHLRATGRLMPEGSK